MMAPPHFCTHTHAQTLRAGHDNQHHDNVYAYVGKGFGICNQLEGHGDSFYSNHVVQTSDGNYGNGQTCSGAGFTTVHDNKIYTPTGAVTECGMSLAAWQAQGGDPGTVAATTPTDDALLALARSALGLPAAIVA